MEIKNLSCLNVDFKKKIILISLFIYIPKLLLYYYDIKKLI